KIKKRHREESHGLFIEDGTVGLFVRESGAREGHGVGWGDESGGGAASARDEVGRPARDLSHGGCKKRGGDGVGGRGRCVGSADAARADQGRKGDQDAEESGGDQGTRTVCGLAAGPAGTSFG